MDSDGSQGYRRHSTRELLLRPSVILGSMDMGTGIGYDGPYWCFLKKICICVYDTYQIHKYVIFQKNTNTGIRLKYFNNNYSHSRIKAASSQQEAHQSIKPSRPSSSPNKRLIPSILTFPWLLTPMLPPPAATHRRRAPH
jgi:hypothetical protein